MTSTSPPTTATVRNPEPAYPPHNRTAIYGDEELYKRLELLSSDPDPTVKTLLQDFEVPIRSGRAWVVKAGISTLLLSLFFHPSHFTPKYWTEYRWRSTIRSIDYSVHSLRTSSRRFEHLVSPQSTREILGFAHETAACFACECGWSTLELFTLHEAARYDSRG